MEAWNRISRSVNALALGAVVLLAWMFSELWY
jgi:hypothetical protein